jgi:hypothetical protein
MAIKGMEVEINPEPKKSMRMTICPWNTTIFGLNVFQNIPTSGQCDPLYIVANLSSSSLLGTLIWPVWSIGRQIDEHTNHLGEREVNPPRPLQN